ncbi:unnamed protein product [Ceutorhynchus assimilis]|uniref:Enhancer of yellow 2 transcription factor n=1 Tax=Ceutorhynchus assimilis TaxID=467358 RepID=A0A9N9M882_9CUCU|nr:unnamed protein product [Ceutorhynchus assimilis]
MADENESRVNIHLDVNNGLERVTELIETRLVESGWKDEVRLACQKLLIENKDSKVDDLIEVLTPKARAMVPDSVKKDLLNEITAILSNMEKAGYTKTLENK